MKTDGKVELKERFVELRATGRSYADCAAELGVSKPTLISWAKDLEKELWNARTIRLDELFEKFAVSKARRVEVFGKRLEAILGELDGRDLADVRTEALLSLALRYGERLAAEAVPLTLQGEEQEVSFESLLDAKQVTETWPV